MVKRGILLASLIQVGRQQPHPIQSNPIQSRPIPQLSVFLHIRPGRLTVLRDATTVQIHQVKLQGAAVVAFKTYKWLLLWQNVRYYDK